MTAGRAAALVLAAGASRRLGRSKALLRLDGRSLLARAVDAAQASRCQAVYVVTRPDDPELERAVSALPCTNVPCPEAERGMGHSIAAGVRAIAADRPAFDALVLLLVDQPRIEARHLDALLDALDERRSRAASAYQDTLGAPAAFDRSCFPALAQLVGDQGAKALLLDGATARLPCPQAALDIDTPADLQRAGGSDPGR